MGRNLILLIGSLALLAVALESAARLAFPVPPTWRRPQVRHLESPRLGWVLPAKLEGVWTIDAPVRTNAHGLRDDEFPRDKPPAELRILALGDSFTFALGVRFEDLWVQQLERRLEAERGAPVQVINAAVAGYNTRQELIYLLSEGLELEPDVVVIAFYWNDLLGNEVPLPDLDAPRVARGPSWYGERREHTIPRWIRDTLRRSVLFYQLVRRAERLAALLDPPDDPLARVQRALLEGREEPLAPYWERTQRHLLAIHAACASRGIPVILMAFPMENQIRRDYPDMVWGERLEKIWEPSGMPFVDLEPSYRQALARGRNPFLPYDLHPSAEGMRIAAEELVPALRHVLGDVAPAIRGTQSAVEGRRRQTSGSRK